MTWAPENPVSIRNSIRAAREGVRSIREVIGHEIWQATNELFLWFMGEEAASQVPAGSRRGLSQHPALDAAVPGPRAQHDAARRRRWTSSGWACCSSASGRRRARWTCTTTSWARPRAQQPLLQTALWLSLLRACSGFEAFMRRQQGRVSRDAAVPFLLFEARFPRSLRYCIRSAVGLARRVAPPEAKGAMAAARTRLEALDRWLDEQEKQGHPAVGARAAHARRRRSGRDVRRAAARRRRRDRDDHRVARPRRSQRSSARCGSTQVRENARRSGAYPIAELRRFIDHETLG